MSGVDGLPAAGWGTRISDVDPNPTDATLVDAEIPAPGAGFFYLKGVVDASGAERGLGATGDGRPRGVLVSGPAP